MSYIFRYFFWNLFKSTMFVNSSKHRPQCFSVASHWSDIITHQVFEGEEGGIEAFHSNTPSSIDRIRFALSDKKVFLHLIYSFSFQDKWNGYSSFWASQNVGTYHSIYRFIRPVHVHLKTDKVVFKKSHREKKICIFFQSTHQVDMKNVIEF